MFYSKDKKNPKEAHCTAEEQACNIYDAACESTTHLKNDIRQNPIRSTLIALAAGYVLGAIFRL